MSASPATELTRQLDRLRDRSRRRLLGAGLLVTWVIGGAGLLAAIWTVGAPVWPVAWCLWGLSAVLAVILTILIRKTLIRPLAALRTRSDLARAVEARGDHANLLVAAEESLRRPERWPSDGPVAAVLVARLRERARAILDGVTPALIAPVPHGRRWAVAAGAVVLVAAALLLVAPQDMVRGAGRLARPWLGPPPPPTVGIFTLPGEAFAVVGDTVMVAALDVAAFADEPTVCEVRLGTGPWQPVIARRDRAAETGLGRRGQATLPDVREDFAWRFRRGDLVAPERRLVVRDHPLLTSLSIRIVPPAYTGLATRELPHLPARLEVPAGSVVTLAGRTNHPVETARLIDAAGDTLDLAVEGDHLTVTLPVPGSRAFAIVLDDPWGLTNAAPLHYELMAALDQAPSVSLTRRDNDGLLPLDGALTLQLDGDDDYGIGSLDVAWRSASRSAFRSGRGDRVTAWRSVRLPAEGGRGETPPASGGVLGWSAEPADGDDPPLQRRLNLELATRGLDLVPGDVLELSAVARDRRRPPPAGVTRSRVLRLLVPSSGEVLARQAETTSEKQGELAEMQNRERELAADLDRLSRELLKRPIPDWSRQQEMEEAIRRQQRLREELDRVAQELNRELDQLARSNLTSPRQLERAQELASLLEMPMSEELTDLMSRLDEGGERLAPDQVARALREVADRQKDLARRMEAARATLDRIAREQDMEGMTALLEQLMRDQQELADRSRDLAEAGRDESEGPQDGEHPDDGPPSESGEQPDTSDQADGGESAEESGDETGAPSPEELARRQEALREELEQLRDELARTVEEMNSKAAEGGESSSEEQQRQEMQEALERLQEQLDSGDMEKAAQQLAQMDPEEAAKLQQQAVNDLGALYHVLLQTQQAMQMSMEMNHAVSLRQLAADLLGVSERQETIADAVPATLRDVRSRELTRGQHRLQRATVRLRSELAGLMDEAPTRIIKQLEKLDGVIEEMGRAVVALEENRAPAARRHTRAGLTLTNRAIIGLLTEAQASSGSGQGGQSQPSAAEKLQELARQQAGLNGATEELRRMLADRGLSQETRAGMERLGRDQAALARQLGEVSEMEADGPGADAPAGERILGDLEHLARDMESIAGDLDSGLVSEETISRQVRILGRMLDARNSVRQRDYSTRRESLTATELYADPEAGAGTAGDEDGAPSRMRYQPLDRAPLEYRDLVRRYFATVDSLRRSAPPAGRELP